MIANVLMQQNTHDYSGVQALAKELGCAFQIDPTITPHIDGDMSLLKLRIPTHELAEVMRDPAVISAYLGTAHA